VNYRAAIALGSNLGDRLAIMRAAVDDLERLGSLEAISSLYETAPVGGPEQGPFLNAVVVLDTDLEPSALLAALQSIESRHGRVRTERWGPRTLDLDLVVVEDDGTTVVSDDPRLVLPHPRAAERRFVLEPLAEVWPEAPITERSSAAEALEGVADQEVEVLGADWIRPRWRLARVLVSIQILLFLVHAGALLLDFRFPTPGRWQTWVGLAAVTLGAVLAGWAVGSLGPALSPHPEPRPGTMLVQRGPYAHLRHPIYAGLALAALGTAISIRSWIALTTGVVLAAFLAVKARYEESRLRVSVPGYAAYQRRVPGRMIYVPKAPD